MRLRFCVVVGVLRGYVCGVSVIAEVSVVVWPHVVCVCCVCVLVIVCIWRVLVFAFLSVQ